MSESKKVDRPLTYRDAGVDIDKGDALVERIKALTSGHRTQPGLLSGVGGFASLFALRDLPDLGADPVLVAGTDGVGTKLKVAFRTGRHDTVGIDLVAMSVNDIVTTGATPLFFLDYFATGRLEVDVAEAVVRGVVEGCRRAGCALVGGETAEMPGLYADGEYDLAGFAVGVVDRSEIIDGRDVQVGDVVVGVASHGIHSNGLSLAQKVLFDHAGLENDARLPEMEHTVAEELLVPTALYARLVRRWCREGARPKALAHITGGGLPGNVPRVLPRGTVAALEKSAWTVPLIFQHIARLGSVDPDEMFRTFNMGVGLVLVLDPARVEAALAIAEELGEQAFVLGAIEAGPRQDSEAEAVLR